MNTKNKKKKMTVLFKMSIVPFVLVILLSYACKSVQKSVNADKAYLGNVVENPLFDGKPAEEGFHKYISQNVIYLPKAMEDSITGDVFVEFFVEKDGSVSNVKVVGSTNPALEEEALRVVKSSPNWTPKKINGEPVRMNYTLPFYFRLFTMAEYKAGQLTGRTTSLFSKKIELAEETQLLEEVVVLGVSTVKHNAI